MSSRPRRRGICDDPAQAADEATRIASARRSCGNAAGEADPDPAIPYAGSTAPPRTYGTRVPSEPSVAYEGCAEVPERVTINITVQARSV